MGAYLFRLTAADEKVKAKAQAQAAREGRTFRGLLMALLRYYVTHGFPSA